MSPPDATSRAGLGVRGVRGDARRCGLAAPRDGRQGQYGDSNCNARSHEWKFALGWYREGGRGGEGCGFPADVGGRLGDGV